MKRRVIVAILLAVAVPAAAQDNKGFVWDDRPTIVFGEDFNIELKGRAQFDWRRYDPEVDETTFDVRTLRFGLQGEITRHFDVTYTNVNKHLTRARRTIRDHHDDPS